MQAQDDPEQIYFPLCDECKKKAPLVEYECDMKQLFPAESVSSFEKHPMAIMCCCAREQKRLFGIDNDAHVGHIAIDYNHRRLTKLVERVNELENKVTILLDMKRLNDLDYANPQFRKKQRRGSI